MLLRKEQFIISENDYLQGEHSVEFKHEYIDGQVYAMVGASTNQNYLAGNLFVEINRVRLERHNSEQNMHRYYLMFLTRNLFDEWILICEWDRIGTKGGCVLERVCSGLDEAEQMLAKKKQQKEKHGYQLIA